MSWGITGLPIIEKVIDTKGHAYRYGKSQVFVKYHIDLSLPNFGLDEVEIENDLKTIIRQYKMVLVGYEIEEIERN